MTQQRPTGRTDTIVLRATRRFVDAYDRAQPLRKACVIGALSDLRRQYQSGPDSFLRKYNKVKGLVPTVWEMDLSGAERLLFHWREGVINLLAMGGHDIVGHYKNTAALETELGNMRPLPPGIERLTAAGFFTFSAETEWKQFANEADPAWLTYLDRDQATAVADILKSIQGTAQDPRAWSFWLILGGPGTGKTSILLNLFCRAIELDIVPQIVIEDPVLEFVRDAGGSDLAPYRVGLHDADVQFEGGVLLVDDPRSMEEIKRAKSLAQMRLFRCVVVAVDPLQLASDATDIDVQRLVTGMGAKTVYLRSCYRQKEKVGQAAKKALDAIAQSSPFLRQDKKDAFAAQRFEITHASNDLTFVNPAGRAKVYPCATLDDIQTEVRRLQRAPALWKHTSPYLVARDDENMSTLPSGWEACLDELSDVRWIKMSQALDIKGIEFQHVLLIISETLFLQLENGFEGASRALYTKRRLYRIPLSRAKDSITVFVVADADLDEL